MTPENVHAARVAVRRLRTLLAAIAPALHARQLGRLRQDLADIADELGAVRDVDVRCGLFLSSLPRTKDKPAAGQPGSTAAVATALRSERRRARRQLRSRLGSATTTAQMRAVSRLIASDALFKTGTDPDALLVHAMRRRCRKVARSLEEDHDTPARRHALRIRIKKCRYLLDACGIQPDKGRDRKARARLGDLQDCLGDLNDFTQARRWLQRQPADPRVAAALRAQLRSGSKQALSRLEHLRGKIGRRDLRSLARTTA